MLDHDDRERGRPSPPSAEADAPWPTGGCDLGKTSSHGQPCSTTTSESEEAAPSATESADAFAADNGGCDLGKTSSHGQPCKSVLADAVNRQSSAVPSAEVVDETDSGNGSVAAKADELRNKQTKRDTSAASAVVDWGTDASDSTSSGTDPYPDPVTTDSIWVIDDDADGDADGEMKNRETSNVPGSVEKGASGVTWATFGYPSPTMTPTPAPVVVVTMRQRISAWIKMGVQGRYNVIFFSVLGGILIGGTLVACFLSRRRASSARRLADDLEKALSRTGRPMSFVDAREGMRGAWGSRTRRAIGGMHRRDAGRRARTARLDAVPTWPRGGRRCSQPDALGVRIRTSGVRPPRRQDRASPCRRCGGAASRPPRGRGARPRPRPQPLALARGRGVLVLHAALLLELAPARASRVLYDSLTEKNIGPSSASHSPSTAVVHCMYSFDVMMSSWYVQKSGVYRARRAPSSGAGAAGCP